MNCFYYIFLSIYSGFSSSSSLKVVSSTSLGEWKSRRLFELIYFSLTKENKLLWKESWLSELKFLRGVLHDIVHCIMHHRMKGREMRWKRVELSYKRFDANTYTTHPFMSIDCFIDLCLQHVQDFMMLFPQGHCWEINFHWEYLKVIMSIKIVRNCWQDKKGGR